MSTNKEANKAMTMGAGNTPKSMAGCWTVKGKKRNGNNRKRPKTAKQRARKK